MKSRAHKAPNPPSFAGRQIVDPKTLAKRQEPTKMIPNKEKTGRVDGAPWRTDAGKRGAGSNPGKHGY